MDRDPVAVAAEMGRFLFFLGQFPATPTDRSLVLSLLPLFWTGGRRGLARVHASYLKRSGGVANTNDPAASLRRLAELKVIAEVGTKTWDLREPDRWAWPADRRALANTAWQQATGVATGWPLAEAMQLLEQIVARLPPTAFVGTRRARPTFHPDDRPSREWHDQFERLANEYGLPAVIDALREAKKDPESIPLWTPNTFSRLAWALALRSKAAQRSTPGAP